MRRDQPSGAIRDFSRRPLETNILMILLRGLKNRFDYGRLEAQFAARQRETTRYSYPRH